MGAVSLFPIIAGIVSLLFFMGVGVLLLVWRLNRSPQIPEAPVVQTPTLAIDLERLAIKPLAVQAPYVDLFGRNTQIAVLVLAPMGRGTDFPERSQWHEVVECAVPGMAKVLDFHQPTFRLWPEQVSQHGFVQAFFNAMQGNDSKQGVAARKAATGPKKWYRLAGKVEWRGVPLLMGLVLVGDGSPLSPLEMEHSGKWIDSLKVKG